MMFRQGLAGCALATAMAAAAPAQAVIVTFATFDAIGGSNLRWTNDGAGESGSGGSLVSIASPGGAGPAPRQVSFSFVNVAIAPEVTAVTALFSLNASAPTGNPAAALGPFLLQDGIGGSFSFTTTSSLQVGSTFFAAGSNLLSGTFGGASILGGGAAGTLGASTPGGDTVVFTSDFLDFGAVTDRDISLSLAAISPALARLNAGAALSGFTATGSGSFSSDGAPALAYPPTPGVPEPSTWAMTLLGFGLLGAGVRRRRSRTAQPA